MLAFEIIKLAGDLDPNSIKLHLAGRDNHDDPWLLYREGEFEEWQNFQSKKNFERPIVLTLISLPGKNRWLFAGVYRVVGREIRFYEKSNKDLHYYNLAHVPGYNDLDGRLIVNFKRPGRNSYLDAEKWLGQITVEQILDKPMANADFPGFRDVHLTRKELVRIVHRSPDSWRTALSNVSGVYLIRDGQTDKFYVGSAYGQSGIWGRWSSYVETRHGGNKMIKNLLTINGIDRADAFHYSILEIADIDATDKQIIAREQFWKEVLGSRAYGLNAN